jgi:magnesium-transporting ATPase (P-type)
VRVFRAPPYWQLCRCSQLCWSFPLLPGSERVENILFWLVAAVLILTLVFQNWARIDHKFFRSLPNSPDLSFSRLFVQVLALIVVVVPYALPTRTKYTIPANGIYISERLVLVAALGIDSQGLEAPAWADGRGTALWCRR